MKSSPQKDEDKKQKSLGIPTLKEREAALARLKVLHEEAQHKEEQKKVETAAAEIKFFKNLQPGQMVDGQGVFLGRYAPKDREGNSLNKIFNVFAAPQDLPDRMKYIDVVKHIAQMKEWYGFDGTNYENDKEICKALKDGSYKGGWIIPPLDILVGHDVDRKKTTADNLYAHKNKGYLKDTFHTAESLGSTYPDWYWSSTEDHDSSLGVHSIRFSDAYDNWDNKDGSRLSCRPVRLVEVRP